MSPTDFHISGSELFKLLRGTGFEVVDFRELFAAAGADGADGEAALASVMIRVSTRR